MDSKALIARFAQAALPLELSGAPLVRRGAGLSDIVMLDIARPDRRARHERFRLYLGAKGNRVEVEHLDPRMRQLVLLIHEPRRSYEVFVPKHAGKPQRFVRAVKYGWFVEQTTDENKRHFLAGMDESHLFVAQLPRPATTVWRAHLALRGDAVRVAEKGALEPTVRQGEWFLVDLPPQEARELAALAGKSLAPIQRSRGIAEAGRIPRAGRQHVADEVLVVNDRVYVRGSIRHPDHATVTFRTWRRAVPNTETVAVQPRGVLWVD